MFELNLNLPPLFGETKYQLILSLPDVIIFFFKFFGEKCKYFDILR